MQRPVSAVSSRQVLSAVFVSFATLMAACETSAAGSTGVAGRAGGATAPARFGDVLEIFSKPTHNCGICHGSAPAASNGGLQFNPSKREDAHTALVGVMAGDTRQGKCAGKTYVVPGEPEASLLVDKLANETPSCGARMPQGFMPLDAMELETVRSWITAGALND